MSPVGRSRHSEETTADQSGSDYGTRSSMINCLCKQTTSCEGKDDLNNNQHLMCKWVTKSSKSEIILLHVRDSNRCLPTRKQLKIVDSLEKKWTYGTSGLCGPQMLKEQHVTSSLVHFYCCNTCVLGPKLCVGAPWNRSPALAKTKTNHSTWETKTGGGGNLGCSFTSDHILRLFYDLIQPLITLFPLLKQTSSMWSERHFVHWVYLHECNKEEEGVGSPPDLLVQEPGQKGEHPILGGTGQNKNRGCLFLTFRLCVLISLSLIIIISCFFLISRSEHFKIH